MPTPTRTSLLSITLTPTKHLGTSRETATGHAHAQADESAGDGHVHASGRPHRRSRPPVSLLSIILTRVTMRGAGTPIRRRASHPRAPTDHADAPPMPTAVATSIHRSRPRSRDGDDDHHARASQRPARLAERSCSAATATAPRPPTRRSRAAPRASAPSRSRWSPCSSPPPAAGRRRLQRQRRPARRHHPQLRRRPDLIPALDRVRRSAGAPPTRRYTYGYGRAEDVAGTGHRRW